MKKILTSVILLLFIALPTYATDFEKTFSVQVTNSDVQYVVFTVLKPNGAEELSQLTDDNVPQSIYQMQAKTVAPNGNKNFVFTLKVPSNAPRGYYYISITQVGDETQIKQTERFYLASEEEVAFALNKIWLAQGDNIISSLDEYTIQKEILKIADLDEVRTISDFSQFFTDVRIEKFPQGYGNGQDDLLKHINLILFANALNSNSGDLLIGYFDKYIGLFEGIADKYTFSGRTGNELTQMKEKFVNQFINSKDSVGTHSIEKLEKNSKIALALTMLSYGTVNEKADALRTYGYDLGINLDFINDKKIDLSEVAKKLIGVYTEVTQLKADVDNIAKNIAEEMENNKPINKPVSGGGGRAGANVYTPIITPVVTPIENLTIENRKQIFNDLDNAEWAIEDINLLYDMKIISGDGSKFFPNQMISRAEFAKMLVLSLDFAANEEEVNFTDCTKDDWYYPYIVVANKAGITNGKENGSFGAIENITRQDMAVMIYRAIQSKGIILNGYKDTKFKDQESVGDYANVAILSLAKAGVLGGFDDNSIRPLESATRAQAATLISRLVKLAKGGVVK